MFGSRSHTMVSKTPYFLRIGSFSATTKGTYVDGDTSREPAETARSGVQMPLSGAARTREYMSVRVTSVRPKERKFTPTAP